MTLRTATGVHPGAGRYVAVRVTGRAGRVIVVRASVGAPAPPSSTSVSPVHWSKTSPTAGGSAKTLTREPAGYVPPPLPPLTVTATSGPLPLTTR